MADKEKSIDQLLLENEELKLRLAAKDTLIETFRESENKYAAVYNSMSEGLAIHELMYDNSGKITDYIITDVNSAYEQIIGLKKKQVVGRKATDVYKTGLPPYLDIYAKVALTGDAQTFETYFSPIDKHFHVSVFSPEKGKFATVFQDISERKKTEEELQITLQRFYLMLSRMYSGLLLMTNDGKVEFLNQAFCNFYNLNETPENLIGISFEELLKKINPAFRYPESAESSIREILLEGKPVRNEEFEMQSGRTLLRNFIPLYIQGVSHGHLWVNVDITERKLADEALIKSEQLCRVSEERFRNLVKNAPTAIYEIDFLTRKFITVNDAMCEMSGYSREELFAMDSILLLEPNSRKLFLSRISKALKGEEPEENAEYKVIAKDGHVINAVLNMKFTRNKLGIPIGTLVVGHDITLRQQAVEEIRKAAEAIKESERRFRTLTENIPDMISRFDSKLRLIYANEAVLKTVGLPMDGLTGETPGEYSSMPESAKSWENVARNVLSDNTLRRMQITNKWQGISRTFDVILIPENDANGNATSLISVSRDISDMKHAENVLRESEQRLKYHLENSPLAVIECDNEFNIIQWSNEAEKIFGLRREEVIGVRIDMINIIYPEDIPAVEKTMLRLTGGKELKIVSQNRNLTKSGEILECIWYNSVLLDDKGEMSSVMSLVEDVTLLRQIEKELMESRESYKELVTNARSMILKFDNQARFTFINEFALDFFGYKEEEIIGKSVMIVVPETESTGRDLNEMIDNIVEDPDNYSINLNENVKKNGEKVWVEWHNKALFDESGKKTGHIAIGVDITKRKKAEEGLKESERKLRSVLDATQESIYMFDKDGMIVMSNTTGVRRLKRKVESEVVMHHISEFMTPELTEKRLLKINEVFKSGIPLSYEDERETTAFQHNLFPVFKDENVMFVVTYSTNITESRNAEAKLKQSEDRFRTIAESLTVIVSITKISDSTVTFLNDPFEKSFGYKKGEILGTRMPDFYYYPDDNKFLVDSLKVKGLVENVEVRVKRRDGTPFWIMTSIRKINYLNEPSYLTASIDISETKKSQEELLRLNRTLDAQSKSSQAMMHNQNELDYINEVCKIIIEDCGHSMVWVGYAQNDKHKSVKPVAYFGFDKGYIDQMNITWDDSERGSGPTGSAIKNGEPSICRNMLTDPCFAPWRDAAVKRGYASSVVLPLKSEGKAFGAISIYSKDPDPFTDSEIDLLTELADDLAYGILFIRLTEYEKEATRAIKENELRLKELIATKDKFFNIIAHDLKNPFTSLLGASELLYDNITKMSAENVKKLAMILNDSAKGGYSILQNLLDWSRSQTGQLKFIPEKVNLKSIIDENIDNLQLQINNKEINLKSDQLDDLFINADKNMINTVLRNLLSNAVKYTFNNGIIRVMVAQDKDKITLTVKDSGIGISKEKADSLFKLENALSLPGTAKEQGTGLGLKLCKEFTEKMGGRIWVESEVGKGSEFKFTIPIIGVKA